MGDYIFICGSEKSARSYYECKLGDLLFVSPIEMNAAAPATDFKVQLAQQMRWSCWFLLIKTVLRISINN